MKPTVFIGVGKYDLYIKYTVSYPTICSVPQTGSSPGNESKGVR